MFARSLRRRLVDLTETGLAALGGDDQLDEAASVVDVGGDQWNLDTRDPTEHIRRAIAAKRAGDATLTDANLYGQLRLLLNQLESGRVSTQPTRQLETVRTAPPAPRPRLRTLLRRKAQAAVRRVVKL